jgi:hypothetical protein
MFGQAATCIAEHLALLGTDAADRHAQLLGVVSATSHTGGVVEDASPVRQPLDGEAV